MKNDQILIQAIKKVCLDKKTPGFVKHILTDATKSYFSESINLVYTKPELGDLCHSIKNINEEYKILNNSIICENVQLVDAIMTKGEFIGTVFHNIPINMLSKN
jgi:hypothetical protein